MSENDPAACLAEPNGVSLFGVVRATARLSSRPRNEDEYEYGGTSMKAANSGIAGCEFVPISANRDDRGCLFELFRDSWSDAFRALQWNACASKAGVVRGAHVHVDYDEYYTLPLGRAVLGLADIRKNSPTYRKSAQIAWRDKDGFAVVIPRGVVHVLLFEEDSVLVFGLSGFWQAKYDVVGCQWNDPELGLQWPTRSVVRSDRDTKSGDYQAMLRLYEDLSREVSRTGAAHAPVVQM